MTYEYVQEFEERPLKSCKNCRHFCEYIKENDPLNLIETDEPTVGECRRFPPDIDEAGPYFPVVSEDMWCGEFDF